MKLNILVFGAGAIGCFVGGSLAAAGHQVTLVGRSQLMQIIENRGLRLIWPQKAASIVKPHTCTSLEEVADTFDFVLLTVKSPATEKAAAQLATSGILRKHSHIISLQNGIGNEAMLTKTFHPEQVIAGTITIPVEAPEPGIIKVSKAKGGIGLAPLVSGQPVQPLAKALSQAGLATTVYTDYQAMKWSKLLLNIINNAASAILDQPPAEMITNPEVFNMEIAAIQEGVAVMAAQNIKAVKLPGYPVNWLAWLVTVNWLPLAAKRAILRPFMLGGRGSKMPSLHIDVAAGRSTSEVDVLNGAIARAGQRLGVETPVNETLTTILNDIVSERTNRSEYNHRPENLLYTIANCKTRLHQNTG
jgi:2-dehydropantoate 2-reductase